jgi:hypothetical protein
MYNTKDYSIFGLCPSSGVVKNTSASDRPKKKMGSQHEILQLSYVFGFIDLVRWLGLLHRISTFFTILVSGLCMLYHNFYYTCSCYLPLTKPDLKVFIYL